MTVKQMCAGSTVLAVWLTADVALGQWGPPVPFLGTVDQLPLTNAVVLWIDGENLTVYLDSCNEVDENKLTQLEIKWDGPGPGFAEERCDFDNIYTGEFDVCRSDKIAKVRSRGFGPVYDLGNVIPEGYLETWSPAESWILDGSWIAGWIGKCTDSPHFGPVPEPSSLMLFCIGLRLLRRRP